mgnify:CR=1 FL=1
MTGFGMLMVAGLWLMTMDFNVSPLALTANAVAWVTRELARRVGGLPRQTIRPGDDGSLEVGDAFAGRPHRQQRQFGAAADAARTGHQVEQREGDEVEAVQVHGEGSPINGKAAARL